ncbi:MAG TPA: hypothetical protein VK130_06855 [Steroidobacteraceae bacterium]|nr:hypothetical protein [Steroidobacteraceae bacterium]
MPQILGKADNLDQLNRQFPQARLAEPVFLNSVPKCGTHLLRNIIRMFVPVEQQYHKSFIQFAILREHLQAFSTAQPMLSWGHLLFSDDSAIALRNVHHVVLVRDPYDWVLARARFFLSDTFKGSLEHLKGGQAAVDEVLNMMIVGIHDKVPALQEIFLHNALSWTGTKAQLLHYEDLVRGLGELDGDKGAKYFGTLLRACGIAELPPDWRQRVSIGADRKQSATARENLSRVALQVPETLPEAQRQLVDVAAPGLRAALGYKAGGAT